MLRAWSDALERRRVNDALVIGGGVITCFLIYGVVIGVWSTTVMAIVGPRNWDFVLHVAPIAWCGLAGLVAAWTRILLPGSRFRASSTLRWATLIGLTLGLVDAGLLLFPQGIPPLDPQLIGYILLIVIFGTGVFLVGATIGA